MISTVLIVALKKAPAVVRRLHTTRENASSQFADGGSCACRRAFVFVDRLSGPVPGNLIILDCTDQNPSSCARERGASSFERRVDGVYASGTGTRDPIPCEGRTPASAKSPPRRSAIPGGSARFGGHLSPLGE